MSAEATGWVFRHSPFKGATFAVHMAVADSVNDQHDNEFWLEQRALAGKARTSRQTTNQALATLVDAGFLTLLEEAPGDRNRYRFEFPDAPVVYDSRRRRVSPQPTPRLSAQPTGVVASPDTGVSAQTTPTPLTGEPKDQPKGSQPALALVGDVDTDPVATVFAAWQQATDKQRAAIDGKRRRLIANALALYPIEDVIDAVRGWRNDPFYCGQNDRSTVYNDLELLLRDAAHIEKFRDLERRPVERLPAVSNSTRNIAAWAERQGAMG